MKKLIFISFFLIALGISSAAQNIIVTNDGTPIKAYNVEIAGNSVFYQASDANDSPIQKINKSDILIIKMQDGSKVDPNAQTQPAAAPAAPSAPASTGSIVPISGETAARNADMIAEFNRELTWEPDEKFLKKHQGKIGNGYTGIMWVEEDSQLYNGEVTISYQRLYDSGFSVEGRSPVTDYRSNTFANPMVAVKVRNNTDRVIYLDLASCFVICGEYSSPFYEPVITTVSNTNTSSKTSEYVNTHVGSSTVSTSDHKYVSGNTASVTRVKEAQQYVSVAPKSTLTLEPQPICKSENGRDSQLYFKMGWLYLSRNVFPFINTPYGQVFAMEEKESPVHFGTSVTYSFSPDHTDLHTIRTEMYMRYVMCTSSTALFAYTIEGDFHRRYPFWIPFYVLD